MNRARENEFVADGRQRFERAIATAAEETVRQRYAAALAEAGLLRRMWLKLRMYRDVHREMRQARRRPGGNISPGALFVCRSSDDSSADP